jgi:hypothetical protein
VTAYDEWVASLEEAPTGKLITSAREVLASGTWPNIQAVASALLSRVEKLEGKSKLIGVEVPCNYCGLPCTLSDPDAPSHGSYGLIGASVTGSYASTPGNGSGALDDMTRYTFSLCEFCLDYLFTQFAIPVSITCLIDNEIVPWRSAATRVSEDDWRAMKDKFFKERDRRDHAREKLEADEDSDGTFANKVMTARVLDRTDILSVLRTCGIEPAGIMSSSQDLLAVRRYIEGLQAMVQALSGGGV